MNKNLNPIYIEGESLYLISGKGGFLFIYVKKSSYEFGMDWRVWVTCLIASLFSIVSETEKYGFNLIWRR